jgi:ethanolamine utilization protein EutP
MSTSLEAKCIMFTQDSTESKSIFPPGFARAFNCMSIGIITKIDHPQSNPQKANELLMELGLKGPIFKISAFSGEGIEELKTFIKFEK